MYTCVRVCNVSKTKWGKPTTRCKYLFKQAEAFCGSAFPREEAEIMSQHSGVSEVFPHRGQRDELLALCAS